VKRIILMIFLVFSMLALISCGAGTNSSDYISVTEGAKEGGLVVSKGKTVKGSEVYKIEPANSQSTYRSYGVSNDMTKSVTIENTSMDLSNYLPPVQNQGKTNSCVGWAWGYYYKTAQENIEKKITDYELRNDANNICSPSFVYNHIAMSEDKGSMPADAFKLLNDFGCASLKEMPFNESEYEAFKNNQSDLSWPSEDAYTGAIASRTNGGSSQYKSISTKTDDSLNQVKQLLLNKKMALLGVGIYDSYEKFKGDNNIVTSSITNSQSKGTHAQCLVGFDDDKETADGKGAFKVVNSWGTEWGDKGFYWISYQAMKGKFVIDNEVLYVEDRVNYSSKKVAVFEADGSIGKGSSMSIKVGEKEKVFFDFKNGGVNQRSSKMPDSKIVLDLNDYAADLINGVKVTLNSQTQISSNGGSQYGQNSYGFFFPIPFFNQRPTGYNQIPGSNEQQGEYQNSNMVIKSFIYKHDDVINAANETGKAVATITVSDSSDPVVDDGTTTPVDDGTDPGDITSCVEDNSSCSSGLCSNSLSNMASQMGFQMFEMFSWMPFMGDMMDSAAGAFFDKVLDDPKITIELMICAKGNTALVDTMIKVIGDNPRLLTKMAQIMKVSPLFVSHFADLAIKNEKLGRFFFAKINTELYESLTIAMEKSATVVKFVGILMETHAKNEMKPGTPFADVFFNIGSADNDSDGNELSNERFYYTMFKSVDGATSFMKALGSLDENMQKALLDFVFLSKTQDRNGNVVEHKNQRYLNNYVIIKALAQGILPLMMGEDEDKKKAATELFNSFMPQLMNFDDKGNVTSPKETGIAFFQALMAKMTFEYVGANGEMPQGQFQPNPEWGAANMLMQAMMGMFPQELFGQMMQMEQFKPETLQEAPTPRDFKPGSSSDDGDTSDDGVMDGKFLKE